MGCNFISLFSVSHPVKLLYVDGIRALQPQPCSKY